MIDREKLIEDAAKAEWAAVWPEVPWVDQAGEFEAGTAAALPVVVAAVTDEVRKLHAPIDAMMYGQNTVTAVKVCAACGTDNGSWQRHPCPTVRLLDEIDAAAGVTR
jgi:hypothetical protein